jgi:hypothetical protein
MGSRDKPGYDVFIWEARLAEKPSGGSLSLAA